MIKWTLLILLLGFNTLSISDDKQVQDCDSGENCYALAQNYKEGKNQDDYKAFLYYQKSCELDSAIGCSGLGVIYYNGIGVTQDQQKASIYFKKGCQLGRSNSCLSLANMYKDGLGVQKKYQTL